MRENASFFAKLHLLKKLLKEYKKAEFYAGFKLIDAG
jgi:hypothetical protein